MQFFLALIGFLFLLMTAGMAVIVWKVRRRMRSLRNAMEEGLNDEAFRRMADKNYYRKKHDEPPMFDEEYFKGDPTGARSKQQAQQKTSTTRRTTKTAAGVTIIDDRDPSRANKKIFGKDEGEYVDFKEE